jgi:hypothetical protein
MIPNQQRIAIAGVCGWTRCRVVQGDPMGSPPGQYDIFDKVPDYLNDLNAMNKAEKILRGSLEQYYTNRIIYERWNRYEHYLFNRFGISAPAHERAEAFLKVLKLWRE